MGKAEGKVEDYFDEIVKDRLQGFTRKCVFPGKRGAPDRIAFIPGIGALFVEIKTATGELSKLQKRELRRMHNADANVVVLSGKREVDRFINGLQKQLDSSKTEEKPWIVDLDTK